MDSILISAMSFSDFLSTSASIAKTVIGLGFVIFIHELGHFLAAKACGVKCEKFYVGFDPLIVPATNTSPASAPALTISPPQ